jgi:PAS domain S-box-containing protein
LFSFPFKDEAGNEIGVIEYVKDITERKLAEQQLAIFKKFADSSSLAYGFADLNGDIIYINPTLCRILGEEKPEDALGKNVAIYYPDDMKSKLLNEVLPAVKSEGGWTGEIPLQSLQGHVTPTIQNVSLIRDNKGNPLYIGNIIADITERKKTEEQIISSLKEKEILLREIHHRVKNNMQVLTSLLSLQSRATKNQETKDILMESHNRVRSMALVHEQLYQSENFSQIDLSKLITNLTNNLFLSYGVSTANISLRTDIIDGFVGINTAIPLGLIINELISNALKYAFPSGSGGEINIVLSPHDGRYLLQIGDNGVGLPEGLNYKNSESLGLQLVNTLIEQLGAEIELDTKDGGTKFKIIFSH